MRRARPLPKIGRNVAVAQGRAGQGPALYAKLDAFAMLGHDHLVTHTAALAPARDAHAHTPPAGTTDSSMGNHVCGRTRTAAVSPSGTAS